MTYNPLDNLDLKKIIFSYLRSPCEYKKPPHYHCIKEWCIKLKMSNQDDIYVNPLHKMINTDSFKVFMNDVKEFDGIDNYPLHEFLFEDEFNNDTPLGFDKDWWGFPYPVKLFHYTYC